MTTSRSHDPLVTVCIPSYNHARFIAETIQGIIDQTYRNIELIIIDDGSRDNSLDVIETFRAACEQRFVRFEIRSRPNKGLSATLNEGLAWAGGEYFSPIASDDIALPNKVLDLLNSAVGHPDVAATFGGLATIDERGKVSHHRTRSGVWDFADIFLQRAFTPAPASMMRTARLRDVNGFDEENLIEDWSMWLKLTADNSKLITISVPVTKYRIHGTNTHGRIEDMHNSRVKIAQTYNDHPLYKEALSRIFLRAANDYTRSSTIRCISMLMICRGIPIHERIFVAAKSVVPNIIIDFTKKFL